MSGGSWDYVSSRFREVGERLVIDSEANRRALGSLVLKVAEALHEIEWVDSGDCMPGKENAAINEALGANADALILAEAVAEAKACWEKLAEAIVQAEAKKP
jgi:hypothetical protein